MIALGLAIFAIGFSINFANLIKNVTMRHVARRCRSYRRSWRTSC